MSSLLPPILLILLTLIQPSYAQITRHRRVTTGRIIAGCIVGGLAAALFIVLAIMMIRRRRLRARPFIPVNTENGTHTQYGRHPMFGWPWRSRNRNIAQTSSTSQMGQYATQGATHSTGPQPPPPVHPSSPPHNPEYPAPNDPLPPPMYGQNGRKYSPPTEPPPAQSTSTQVPYDPPPGPPPAAHVAEQQDQFVGGFRL
ncbi:hypothetical protein BDN70DRAFT_885769 [Pholiota conissans]|uniref:Uncharacterized protein n=1 Tax=Pholiota conissans TaxID=109636 RepID=A0A9P5YQA4_9AGAR|nr:hypothetical protein BDN70DRAFT_885769 [Pholiota conissans]